MKLDHFNSDTDGFVSDSMNASKRELRLNQLARRRWKIVVFRIVYVVCIFPLLLLFLPDIDQWRVIDIFVLLFLLPMIGATLIYNDVVSEIKLLKIVAALTDSLGK
ncbi:hypothetical protein SH528x_003583 [Novipirellula sp. SH528]|uniref:hypothetical protein n=1 Tax=Novipirellula sp. SH528 TaxID=3454466 RepID=UPI003FA191DF